MNTEVDYDLAAAVGELSSTYDFLMYLAKLSPEKMFEAIETRDPGYVEHFEAMDEAPENTYELWKGFGSWTIGWLRAKYKDDWDSILDAYFSSSLHDSNVQRAALWSDVTQVLKEAGF